MFGKARRRNPEDGILRVARDVILMSKNNAEILETNTPLLFIITSLKPLKISFIIVKTLSRHNSGLIAVVDEVGIHAPTG
jgi:hypothetical protein